MTKELTYKDAGVDIEGSKSALERMKEYCLATYDEHVVGGIGAFAGSLAIGDVIRHFGMKDPIQGFSVDGPGTMPIIGTLAREVIPKSFVGPAYSTACHIFADLATEAGYPVALLDVIDSETVDEEIYAEILEGMAQACLEFDPMPRILGGETAQLPGVIVKGQTSFNIFGVSLVDREDKINALERILPGQHIVGVQSKGIHLNGTSLARKIMFDRLKMKISDKIPATGKSVAEELTQKQPNYAKMVFALLDAGCQISACSNITGGGLYDNIERNLPEGSVAAIDPERWPRMPFFEWLIEMGNVALIEAYRTWNMGIGYVFILPKHEDVSKAIDIVQTQFNLDAWAIGAVLQGKKGVEILGVDHREP